MLRVTPTDRETTHLLLIRHGSTDANERRPYILQGNSIDLPLNERGRSQAEAVADLLASSPIRAIHTSTLRRAIETSQAIARRHGLDVVSHPELNEVDVGRWEGLDWAAIERNDPEHHARFLENPAETPYLGGESYADVHRRAAPKLAELLARHAGELIVVVAHNVVNRALLAPLLGLDLRHAKDIAQANTCVNVLKHRSGKTKVITLNSFPHLPESEG